MRLSDSTFVFFSSDNGFHLGEHRMLFGKTKPYATDVRLPMYVAGPGLPRGETRPLPTTHLDITATIAELGGAAKHAPHPLDGLSFKAALGSTPPALSEWRDFSFSEFYVNDNTWRNIRLIDHATGQPAWAFHWWCSNQSEVYREADDPFQMANVGGDDPTPFGRSIVRRYLPATEMRLSDSTFVFFSSDNGFHLGEHRMLFGKTKPYATDVRLPMYVAGPGLPRGETRPLPTTHLDITATIAELGGAAKHAPHPLDGLSFKAALGSTPPALSEWRDFSFSEFYVNDNTWRNIRLIDHATGQPAWAFHWWCSNQSE
ncbi:hypothetical protein EMIHUDRAFT_123682, partial [Emiliania huxleyi CCMP1516]|uniref:Sulfatase N-terminal domain-containing protein n=2 Tax=Emiliania huxleyi TaxID=2903 RepID=A0A0D3JJ20_EMIH1